MALLRSWAVDVESMDGDVYAAVEKAFMSYKSGRYWLKGKNLIILRGIYGKGYTLFFNFYM